MVTLLFRMRYSLAVFRLIARDDAVGLAARLQRPPRNEVPLSEMVNRHGVTPLTMASREHRHSCMHVLVAAGAVVRPLDNSEHLFGVAFQAGSIELVRTVVAARATVSRAVCIAAAVRGNLEIFRFLYHPYANAVAFDITDAYPLRSAIVAGNYDIVSYILDLHGVECVHASERDASAFYSVMIGDRRGKCLRVLYDKCVQSAGWRFRSDDLQYALLSAIGVAMNDLVASLLKAGAEPRACFGCYSPVAQCVRYRNYDALELVLGAGGDPDETVLGSHVLCLAVQVRAVAAVRLLLAHGATPHLYEFEDIANAPVAVSAKMADFDCLDALLASGKFDDRSHPALRTALHASVRSKCRGSLVTLLDYGVSPNAAPTDGRRFCPLLEAVCTSDLDAIRLLLAAGALVDGCATCGEPHLAHLGHSMTLHVAAVELLIRHGASVNDVSREGRSPLFFALRLNNGLVLDILLRAGADITSPSARANINAGLCVHAYSFAVDALAHAGYDFNGVRLEHPSASGHVKRVMATGYEGVFSESHEYYRAGGTIRDPTEGPVAQFWADGRADEQWARAALVEELALYIDDTNIAEIVGDSVCIPEGRRRRLYVAERAEARVAIDAERVLVARAFFEEPSKRHCSA